MKRRFLFPAVLVVVLVAVVGVFVMHVHDRVQFQNVSEPKQYCQVLGPNVPSLYAGWAIRPSRAFTVQGMELDRPHQAGVRVIRQFVETRNSDGQYGSPWGDRERMMPKGWTFDRWLGVRPPNGLRVRAHQQVVFSVVVNFSRPEHVQWKGLRVYHDGTSTVLYPAMAFVVTHEYNKKQPCPWPPLPKGAV